VLRVALTREGGPEVGLVAHAIRSGGVVVAPSDTLYGFSARFDRPSAIRRIATIKGRADTAPFLLLIGELEELAALTLSPPPAPVLDRVWPGPVTLLIPGRPGLPSRLRGPAGTVAVRRPRDRLVRELLAQVGVPIISTSVNRHGEPPLGNPDRIAREFGAVIDVLADLGSRESQPPSTIVDLTRRPPVLVRQGAAAVDLGELERLLRLTVAPGPAEIE
jgi:L-threonylcarbamoyladenylate synthase